MVFQVYFLCETPEAMVEMVGFFFGVCSNMLLKLFLCWKLFWHQSHLYGFSLVCWLLMCLFKLPAWTKVFGQNSQLSSFVVVCLNMTFPV